MANEQITKDVLSALDNMLANTDLKDVSADGAGFAQLKDGYYLAEVENAELKLSKSSQQPMVAFALKVCEDGYDVVEDNGKVKLIQLSKTKGRKIFKYFSLKDESCIQRFASDMLKFEDSNGEALLPKQAFTTSELLIDSLEALIGRRIYCVLETTQKDENTEPSQWCNFITWKRAKALDLPM